MRLLYAAFDPVPFPKGAATRIEATVRALGAAGAEVTLLTPQAPPVPGFAARLEGLDHRPVPVVEDNFLDRALAFRAHVARTLDEGYAACMVRSPWEGVPAARAGLPLIYEVHGFPSVELPAHFPRLKDHPELVGRFVDEELLLLARARLLVTPSQLGQRYLHSRGVRPERVRVIPNSVDRYPEPPSERPPGPFRALYAGTLAPWQGLDTLLEALALLKGRLPLTVRLAGTRKGPWLRQLRRHAQHLRVRSLLEILGPLDGEALAAEMTAADACLAPLPDNARNSLQGCCPVKILEYMAAGRPILSTRIPAVEEILTHRETGWLVRPGSPRALADGLRWLAENPAEAAALGSQALRSVRERFPRAGFEAAVARLLASISA